jgi:hypothetical protein
MQIASIGIDLGKATFHLVALDHHGKVIIQKKFSRKHLLTYTAIRPEPFLQFFPCYHFPRPLQKNDEHLKRLPAEPQRCDIAAVFRLRGCMTAYAEVTRTTADA